MSKFHIKLVKDARSRDDHSIWATGRDYIKAGTEWDTDYVVDFIDTVSGASKAGKWAQLPNGLWVACVYDGQVFGTVTENITSGGYDISVKVLVNGTPIIDNVYPAGTKVSIEVE